MCLTIKCEDALSNNSTNLTEVAIHSTEDIMRWLRPLETSTAYHLNRNTLCIINLQFLHNGTLSTCSWLLFFLFDKSTEALHFPVSAMCSLLNSSGGSQTQQAVVQHFPMARSLIHSTLPDTFYRPCQQVR